MSNLTPGFSGTQPRGQGATRSADQYAPRGCVSDWKPLILCKASSQSMV
jgi:hypothetical protein